MLSKRESALIIWKIEKRLWKDKSEERVCCMSWSWKISLVDGIEEENETGLWMPGVNSQA